jgi:hypothetical protein
LNKRKMSRSSRLLLSQKSNYSLTESQSMVLAEYRNLKIKLDQLA